MGKKFNVDEYLATNEIVITLNGKDFMVRDVPEETAQKMRDKDVSQKDIIKEILHCTDKDLEGYGMATFAGIIKNVTEAIFPPQKDSPETQSTD